MRKVLTLAVVLAITPALAGAPVASNDTASGRALNRRVELVRQ